MPDVLETKCRTCGGAVYGPPGADAATCERDPRWVPWIGYPMPSFDGTRTSEVVSIDRLHSNVTMLDGEEISFEEARARARARVD